MQVLEMSKVKEEGIDKRKEKISEEPNILAQLQEAKKDFIETLKTPKKVISAELLIDEESD